MTAGSEAKQSDRALPISTASRECQRGQSRTSEGRKPADGWLMSYPCPNVNSRYNDLHDKIIPSQGLSVRGGSLRLESRSPSSRSFAGCFGHPGNGCGDYTVVRQSTDISLCVLCAFFVLSVVKFLTTKGTKKLRRAQRCALARQLRPHPSLRSAPLAAVV